MMTMQKVENKNEVKNAVEVATAKQIANTKKLTKTANNKIENIAQFKKLCDKNKIKYNKLKNESASYCIINGKSSFNYKKTVCVFYLTEIDANLCIENNIPNITKSNTIDKVRPFAALIETTDDLQKILQILAKNEKNTTV